MFSTLRKILSLKKAVALREKAAEEGKIVVFTNGCFDILHPGHVRILEACKAKGDLLIVGLNSDDSVRRLKGRGRPVNPQKDRAAVLAGLAAVDAVVLFSEDTPALLLSRLRPDILVKGTDYKKSEIAGGEFAGRVERVRLVPGRSTTEIIRKLKNRI